MTPILLSTPSRLHAGLIEVAADRSHAFGGFGVAIERLGFQLLASQSSRLQWHGPAEWSDPFRQVVERWTLFRQKEAPPIAIEPHQLMQWHQGLGAGTQFACAIATLLELTDTSHRDQGRMVDELRSKRRESWQVWGDNPETAVRHLQQATGRGKRSWIGLIGFLMGGWIVDWGFPVHSLDADLPPLAHGWLQGGFPSEWTWVIAIPTAVPGVFGRQEAEGFQKAAQRPGEWKTELLRLLEESMIPALQNDDFARFSDSLRRYGLLAGEWFAPVQGGLIRQGSVNEVSEYLQACGLQGVGQSSWGPTLFGIAPTAEEAARIVSQGSSHPKIRSITSTSCIGGFHLKISD
jgi:predicted sugar kinase